MATNPILQELQGLSPGAQQALLQAHTATSGSQPTPTPPAARLQAPTAQPAPAMMAPKITPEMKQSVHGLQDAGPAPSLAPVEMPSQAPAMTAPTMPSVSKVGQLTGTVDGDQAELQRRQATGSGIHQIKNPFLRGLAGTADAVGSIVAPGIDRLIPGTESHHQMLLDQAQSSLNNDLGVENKKATNANLQADVPLKQAQTQGDVLANASEPQRATDTHLSSTASTRETNDRAEGLENPKEQWSAVAGFEGPNGEPLEREQSSGQYRIADISGATPIQKAEAPKTTDIKLADGKIHTMGFNAKTNKFDIDEGESGFKPATTNVNTGEKNLWSVPDGKGGRMVVSLHAGMPLPEGALSLSGQNTLNLPTSTQRTAAGRAATVVAMAPEVLADIDKMAPKMGPIAGRWNDFMQGKVGADDPDFAGLRSDLTMMSTAVALAHAQGRLPENLREEFDHMINAPKQTPENIKSTIQHIMPWMEKMQEQGNVKDGATPNASQEMITVQIPGQPPGQIHASQKAAFLAKYPNAKVQ
jgi:hypothetical protein